MSEAESVSMGTSLAIGLPCFVMMTPSGPSRSRIARALGPQPVEDRQTLLLEL
jgi:hypothetical protein